MAKKGLCFGQQVSSIPHFSSITATHLYFAVTENTLQWLHVSIRTPELPCCVSVGSISRGVAGRLSHEPQREQLEQMGTRWMKGRRDRAAALIFKQWTCMLLRPAGKRIKSSQKSNRLLRQWNQKTEAQSCRGLSNTVLHNLANLISAVSRRWGLSLWILT